MDPVSNIGVAKRDESSKRARGFRARIRNITLVSYIRLLIASSVTLGSVLAGSYAFRVQYQKGLMDTWAINFLQLENLSNELHSRIQSYTDFGLSSSLATLKASQKYRRPIAVYEISRSGASPIGKPVRGANKTLTLKDFVDPGHDAEHYIYKFGRATLIGKYMSGKDLLRFEPGLKPEGRYLLSWRVNFRKVMLGSLASPVGGILYIVNRKGDLIYSSSAEVNRDNFSQRNLVKHFQKTRFSKGELEFDDSFGRASYGFFAEISGTNLVVFQELSKEKALERLRSLLGQFAAAFIIILVVVLLLVQVPLRRITTSMRELMWMSLQISKGNFEIKRVTKGFGEIGKLLSAFTQMAESLQERDRKVQALMIEQQKKVKLEREISVAKSVQDNFLPAVAVPSKSGFLVDSVYFPAEMVAGDWYTVRYFEERNETVVAIADVSGHDMAASMYTAVIATCFEEAVDASDGDRFDAVLFARKMNTRLVQFGKFAWHATLLVMSFKGGSDEVRMVNCGHTFPLHMRNVKGEVKIKAIRMPSDPVGLAEEITYSEKLLKFGEGETLIGYTDGVTEARDSQGLVFGSRKLQKFCKERSADPLFDLVQGISSECDRYREGTPPTDDICIVGVRRERGHLE